MITAPRAATLGCLLIVAAVYTLFALIGADLHHSLVAYLAQHAGVGTP